MFTLSLDARFLKTGDDDERENANVLVSETFDGQLCEVRVLQAQEEVLHWVDEDGEDVDYDAVHFSFEVLVSLDNTTHT